MVYRLRHSGRSYPDVLDPSLLDEADFVSGFTREGFVAAVEQVKDYIRAGDVFQVNLSQRCTLGLRDPPEGRDVVRRLVPAAAVLEQHGRLAGLVAVADPVFL